MEFISHRRNTIAQLKKTNVKYGIEVDIRSKDDDIIIHHDPFYSGENFIDWIKEYKHGTLILNLKEEGLEEIIMNIMKKYNINNFFFLDQSFPFLIKTVKSGESRTAVRISEFESIETAKLLSGKVDWVWIDCFSRFPLSNKSFQILKDCGFKICIVSPELQGFDPKKEIAIYNKIFIEEKIIPDAICSKRIDLWEKLN